MGPSLEKEDEPVKVDDIELVPQRSGTSNQELQLPAAMAAMAAMGSSAVVPMGGVLQHLVDGLAWMPLRIGAKRVELLEALTAGGGFDNPQVCCTVAEEMCGMDAASAVEFVQRLTQRLRTFAGRQVDVNIALDEDANSLRARERWRRSVVKVKATRAFLKAKKPQEVAVTGPSEPAPPLVRVQHSRDVPIPGTVLAPVAEVWIASLCMHKYPKFPKSTLLAPIRLVAGIDTADLTRTLRALLCHPDVGATGAPAPGDDALSVCRGITTILEHSRRHSPADGACALERALVDVWYEPSIPNAASTLERVAVHVAAILRTTQTDYERRRAAGVPSALDASLQRVIFALVAIFVCKLDKPLIIGFRTLVPAIFDVHLARGTAARAQLGSMLGSAGFERSLVARIQSEDALVREPFFWSAAGMKLLPYLPYLTLPYLALPYLTSGPPRA